MWPQIDEPPPSIFLPLMFLGILAVGVIFGMLLKG